MMRFIFVYIEVAAAICVAAIGISAWSISPWITGIVLCLVPIPLMMAFDIARSKP